jgi:DNA-binding transcriptional regulator YiaG
MTDNIPDLPDGPDVPGTTSGQDGERVRFVDNLNERIARMATDPAIAEQVAAVRREMAEADRSYAMGLAALRQSAHLTQVEVAQTLGRTQGSVSALEQREDMLLSTLNGYLEAIGGRLRLIVEFHGHAIEVDVAALRPAEPAPTLRGPGSAPLGGILTLPPTDP